LSKLYATLTLFLWREGFKRQLDALTLYRMVMPIGTPFLKEKK